MPGRIIKPVIIILAAVMLLAGCTGKPASRQSGNDGELTVVTSFYPIYLHTINIAGGIPGVKVLNMTQPQTGCLHDYQLTPSDMKLLEQADIFVVNGAGMESFLDKVINQLPDVKIVEASKGIELIPEEHGEDDGESFNPHVWVSVSGAIEQVDNIAEQLAELDRDNADRYRSNAHAYIEKLEALRDKMHSVLDGLSNRKIITFHEAFTYFAKEFNLETVAVIEREPGSEPSAAELADTIDKVREAGIKALFAEPQYPSKAADTIARETGAKVYMLDPVVTGEADGEDPDAYIRIMENNLKVLEEALK